MNKVLAQFSGDAPFTILIDKAVQVEVAGDEEWVITGCASGTNTDHDMERMALPALHSMARQINASGVPLRVEHQHNKFAVIGDVTQAWVDDANRLWIKATLDKKNLIAGQVLAQLKGGAKLGLSIGGRVKQAIREMSEAKGITINTFFDLVLDEVSVTPRPSYFEAWLLNKSVTQTKGENIEQFYGTPIYDSFLRETPVCDYLMAIEKSIPEDAWVKVDKNDDNNIMNVSKEYVDAKFDKLEANVMKAIEALVKAVDETAEETAEGKTEEKDMETSSEEGSSKEKTGQDKGGIDTSVGEHPELQGKQPNGDNDAIREQEHKVEAGNDPGDEKPLRQSNPPQEKPKVEDDGTATKHVKKSSLYSKMKEFFGTSSSEETMGSEEKEMSSTDEHTHSTEKEETPETHEEGGEEEHHSEEKPHEESHSSESDSSHSSESSSEKKPAMSDYELPELKANKSIPELDIYAAYVGDLIEKQIEKHSGGNGKRVPGVERMVLDMIQNNPEIQKSIATMLHQPGVKKSVIGGTPYAYGKDGRRFKLVPEQQGETAIHKEISELPKGAKFQDVYKSKFASKGLEDLK